MHYLLIFISFFCISCSYKNLDVYRHYITHKDLMSRQAHTRDMREEIPIEGEKMVISWAIPNVKQSQEWFLEIEVIYNNLEHEVFEVPITSSRGRYLFQLLNTEYQEKQGIRSYKVCLRSDNEILEEWRHPLWAELVIVEEEENE